MILTYHFQNYQAYPNPSPVQIILSIMVTTPFTFISLKDCPITCVSYVQIKLTRDHAFGSAPFSRRTLILSTPSYSEAAASWRAVLPYWSKNKGNENIICSQLMPWCCQILHTVILQDKCTLNEQEKQLPNGNYFHQWNILTLYAPKPSDCQIWD